MLLVPTLAIAGCQATPGEGPNMLGAARTSTDALPFDIVDLTPQSVIAYRPGSLPATAASPVKQASTPPFAVGPADVLKVHIVERYTGGVFATLHEPNTLVVTRRVTVDGTIDVPFVGTVPVAGRDLRQIQAEILGRLAGKANEPQVMVELETDRTNVVTVSGAVAKPGPLSLMDGTRSVLEAIDRAGGPVFEVAQSGAPQPQSSSSGASLATHAPGGAGLGGYGLSTGGGSSRSVLSPTPKTLSDASQMRVVVRRQGKVIAEEQLSKIMMGGDIPLQKGDDVVVSPNNQVVTILGAVQRAGNLPIIKPDMTLADALGESGGLLDPRADRTGVLVFRPPETVANPGNRGHIFRLDLVEPVSIFVARQFALYPQDVLYVTNAPLYEYDKILSPLYRTLSIINTVRSQ
jgi:polysaccharide export outer membrane protein